MITKSFEIRDRATFIPVLGIRLVPESEADHYLFSRSGYGVQPAQQAEYVILVRLEGGKVNATYNPVHWFDADGTRTLRVAHQYIIDNWYALESGEVIDVEYLLGETAEKKQSERLVPFPWEAKNPSHDAEG